MALAGIACLAYANRLLKARAIDYLDEKADPLYFWLGIISIGFIGLMCITKALGILCAAFFP
jgi:hypothetical protein